MVSGFGGGSKTITSTRIFNYNLRLDPERMKDKLKLGQFQERT